MKQLNTGFIFSIFLFSIAIIAALIGGINLYKFYSFKQIASQAYGIVIDVSKRSNFFNNRVSYYPRIKFQDLKGSIHEFEGQSSQRNSYKIGDTIIVVYNPYNPKLAEIMSKHRFWYMEYFVSSIPFFILGLLFLFFTFRSKRRKSRLNKSGKMIQASISKIETSKDSRKIIIHAEWTNPKNGKLIEFISDPIKNVTLNGSRKKTIDIIIDPDNPKDYNFPIEEQ